MPLGFGVEATQRGKMDIATEDGDSHREFGRDTLEPVDQMVALLLVRPGRVMVVQVIKEIHAAVKAVEEAPSKTNTPVEELDRTQQGTGKDVFEPGETLEKSDRALRFDGLMTYRIRNGDTQKHDQVLEGLAGSRCG